MTAILGFVCGLKGAVSSKSAFAYGRMSDLGYCKAGVMSSGCDRQIQPRMNVVILGTVPLN